MKTKKILLATLVAVVAIVPLMSALAEERGYWTYYEYNWDIPVGYAKHKLYNRPDAQDAYAVGVSATGEYTLVYDWDYPYLNVWISNDDTHPITVTWRAYYYAS